MTKLMGALSTTYAIYFNKKHKRLGTLFQGKYKAAPITKDAYLLHISRYTHLNPLWIWIKPETVLKLFEKPDWSPVALDRSPTYKNFVKAGIKNPAKNVNN